VESERAVNRVLVGASLLVVGFAAGQTFLTLSEDASRHTSVIEQAQMFDTNDLEALAGFADDLLIGSVVALESSSLELATHRYSFSVDRSLRNVSYPITIYVAQPGGEFVSGDGVEQFVTDQELLSAGPKFLIAVRYQDGAGFFNALAGATSVVKNPTTATIAKYEKALRSAKSPRELEGLGIKPRANPTRIDPLVTLEIGYRSETVAPVGSPEPVSDKELVENIEKFCRESASDALEIRTLLASSTERGSITGSDHGRIVALVNQIAGREAKILVPPNARGELRDKWAVTKGFLKEIRTGVAQLRGKSGGEYIDSLVLLDQLDSSIRIAYAELGVVGCEG
jgi:hypothetical protein